MGTDEILKEAISCGILDVNTIQNKVRNMKRELVLEIHAFDIWFAENDKYWKTHIQDPEKGRRLIKRRSKNDLLDYLSDLYSQNEDNSRYKKATLRMLFPEWLDWKAARTDSTSYMKKITADWNRYFENDSISDTPLNEMDKLFLDTWAHTLIKNKGLTKKQYYNATVIIRQIFDYAVEKDIVTRNTFKEVKINTKLFVRTKKKKSETQVFFNEEKEHIVNDMIRRFNNNPKSTAPLAVILDFEIGVRIGELVAIKTTDIEGDLLTIQRQEVREYEKIDDFHMKFKGFKVVEHPKSSDGFREIYLTDTAKYIIELVQEINKINNESCDDYLFVENGKMICHYNIERRILRGCEAIGIQCKSMHKIRKTYISSLIDSGLNINEIRRLAGHSDERTTYANYCYNRDTEEETKRRIENSLNSVGSKKLRKVLEIPSITEGTTGNQKTKIAL